jgi:hypothetical protein
VFPVQFLKFDQIFFFIKCSFLHPNHFYFICLCWKNKQFFLKRHDSSLKILRTSHLLGWQQLPVAILKISSKQFRFERLHDAVVHATKPGTRLIFRLYNSSRHLGRNLFLKLNWRSIYTEVVKVLWSFSEPSPPLHRPLNSRRSEVWTTPFHPSEQDKRTSFPGRCDHQGIKKKKKDHHCLSTSNYLSMRSRISVRQRLLVRTIAW